MNWIKKLFGFVECGDCEKEFKKKMDTSLGIVEGKEFYYCADCSEKVLEDAFNNRDPFSERSKRRRRKNEVN